MSEFVWPPMAADAHRSFAHHNYWSIESDNLLRELWPNPAISATETGQRMTPKRTKNAVIGRAKRLGLAPKRNRVYASGGPAKTKSWVPRRSPRPPVRPSGIMLPLFPEPQDCSPIGVPLMEASRHHCRAIIESSAISVAGQTIFCGLPKVHGQPFSFCQYHLGRFIAPRVRRR